MSQSAERVLGTWLHDSRVVPCSRSCHGSTHSHSYFKDSPESLIKDIVDSLLALDVNGIDEACHWEMEDRVDKEKIDANKKALEVTFYENFRVSG